ncbi:hypothetical protein GGF40_002468 [Coemansia sp. RSA 1286]|nr:hypothetical protein GGF40_002468 [Coemansia sp. RSA 1286]
MYSRAAAQTIPAECLHGILDYLWDDHVIGTLHSRHRRRTKDYDQTLVHQVLRARNIAPLHVCQRWRVSSITRFFRNLFLDTSKPTELPESAYMLAERLFLVATNNPVLKLKRMPQVRTLALCFVNNKCEGGLEGLKQMVPGLQYVWFQSIGRVSWYMYGILVDLRQRIGAQVSMAHMCFGGKQDTVAVDLVRELAEDLEILCLSRISGGVLSDLVLRVTVAAASTSIVDIDVARPATLERLDIGAVGDAGSLGDEMPQLIDIIEGAPQFCRVALFGAAYLYVKTHIAACVAATDEYTGHGLRNIKLFNLDNAAAGGRFGSSRTDSGASTPWHNAAMTRTDTNTNTGANAAAGGNNNSWHLVSRLLVE